MIRYFARLPFWGQIAVVITIALVLFAVYIAADISRPISQMPWFYWLFIASLLATDVYILANQKPATARIYEQSVFFTAMSIVILATSIFVLIASLFNGSTTGQPLFMAVAWLSPGIIGAKTLFQKWRLRSGHTTS